MKRTKVGIIVTTHHGDELRPNGAELINRFLYTLSQSIKYEYVVYLFNNASPNIIPINFEAKNVTINYEYIVNQKTRGLTGTWNDGVSKAIADHCETILICNDDIMFNETINDFIMEIKSHPNNDNSIFGPVTNGVLSHYQLREEPSNTIIRFDVEGHVLNGFCFGFQSKVFDKFKYAGNLLFNPEILWGGNEEEFMNRVKQLGGELFIVETCWIHHDKIRGWKQLEK